LFRKGGFPNLREHAQSAESETATAIGRERERDQRDNKERERERIQRARAAHEKLIKKKRASDGGEKCSFASALLRNSCPAEEHVREEQRAHSQPKTRSPQLTVWRTLDGATVLESQMILGLYQIYDRFHTAQSINKIAKITHKNYS